MFATQGLHSMDVKITTFPGNWNDKMFQLNGSLNLNNFVMLVADVYIEPAVLAGASYSQMELYADGGGSYYQSICSNQPNVTSGQQALTWTINFKAGTIPPGSTLSDIFFILNANATNNLNSHIYVDNIRLYYDNSNCPPTPTQTATPSPTPTPILGWNFDTSSGNGIGTGTNQPDSWYDNGRGSQTGVISWVTPGNGGSGGCLNSLVTFSALNQSEMIDYTPPSVPWDLSPTGLNVTGIKADVWLDSSLESPSSYPGVQLSVSSGALSHWEQGWTTLNLGAWTPASYNFTWTGGGAANNVQRLWVQISIGGSGSGFGTGNVKLDNIALY